MFNNQAGHPLVLSDTDQKIVGKWVTNADYEFVIAVFEKASTQEPTDVVKGWYEKLTPEQQKSCEIQDADEPLQYFQNGQVMWTEDPHPVQHKKRYKIDVRREISQKLLQNVEFGDTSYDYLCGREVGSTLSEHVPYFEFDDRSPNKYLFIPFPHQIDLAI